LQIYTEHVALPGCFLKIRETIMILGIGIDSIEIERFSQWHTYPRTRLRRILSDIEIDYCLRNKAASAERFALRFAAREAFFKALSNYLGAQTPRLLTVCRHMRIEHMPTGGRSIQVDWQKLLPKSTHPHPVPSILCTFTHTKTTATAFVMLQVQHTKIQNRTHE
jgi:phosphopantetheine--protein transferase-like protein